MQLLLHNCPNEISDELCKSSKTCAVFACSESIGDRGSWPDIVDVIVSLFGKVTVGPVMLLLQFSKNQVLILLDSD